MPPNSSKQPNAAAKRKASSRSARAAAAADSNSASDNFDSDDLDLIAELALSASDASPRARAAPTARSARLRARRTRRTRSTAAAAAAEGAAAGGAAEGAADADDAEGAAAADNRAAGADAAPATPLAQRRPRRPQRRFFPEEDELGSDEEPPPPPTPEADSWHSPEPIAPPTRKVWLPVESAALVLMRRLAGIDNLAALAALDHRYDIDGWSVTYHGEEQLDALAELCAGQRQSVYPLSLEFAHMRGLFDTNFYSIIGLESPRDRMGAGLCLQQNRCVPSLRASAAAASPALILARPRPRRPRRGLLAPRQARPSPPRSLA
jgi:hypothetical protein